jgi:hypothetical protein
MLLAHLHFLRRDSPLGIVAVQINLGPLRMTQNELPQKLPRERARHYRIALDNCGLRDGSAADLAPCAYQSRLQIGRKSNSTPLRLRWIH